MPAPITAADVGTLITYRDPRNQGQKLGELIELVAVIRPIASKKKHKLTVQAGDCSRVEEKPAKK